MPLDPNNPNADTPHAKTVHLASQGWRYGCHSARTGDSRPRGITTRNAVPLRVGVTSDERFPPGELLIGLALRVECDLTVGCHDLIPF